MKRRLVILAVAVLLAINAEVFGAWRIQVEGRERPGPPSSNVRAPRNLSHGFYFGNDVNTNAEGLRGGPVPHPCPPGEIRVLCLGDTETFGASLSDAETWPGAMEALLNAQTPAGRHVRAINAGQPGYSAYQGTGLLREVGNAYDCGIVVAMFGYDDAQGAPACTEPHTPAGPFAWGSAGRLRQSAAWRYLQYRVTAPTPGGTPAATNGPWWERSAANMRWMRDETVAHGGRFVIAAEGTRRLGRVATRSGPDLVAFEHLKAAYRSLASDVLIVDDVFHASGLSEDALFLDPLAVHVSSAGAGLIARAMADLLWQRGWVPRR